MARLMLGLALAVALAGCNTTTETQQAAAPVEALEPGAGTPPGTDVTAAETTTTDAGAAAQVATADPSATLPAETVPVDTTVVDQAAQAYLNCVVGRAAQSAEGGQPAADAVETGIDACRNQFREARWAYRDAGASDAAADRYGVNLLAFVRNEALTFLQAPTQQ